MKLLTMALTIILLAAYAGAGEQTMTKKASEPTTVVMETSEGSVEIELFADKAPVSVSNFLAYVDAGF